MDRRALLGWRASNAFSRTSKPRWHCPGLLHAGRSRLVRAYQTRESRALEEEAGSQIAIRRYASTLVRRVPLKLVRHFPTSDPKPRPFRTRWATGEDLQGNASGSQPFETVIGDDAWSTGSSKPFARPGATIRYQTKGSLTPVYLDTLFLRDACQCEQCVDPSTQQKRFETAQLPARPTVEQSHVLDDGCLHVKWKEGPEVELEGVTEHHSVYTPEFLDRYPRKAMHLSTRDAWPHEAWDQAHLEAQREALTFDHDHYVSDDHALRDVVYALHSVGIAFLRNVPAQPDAVTQIAERIGPVRDTFYGRAWDVTAKPSAGNAACTSAALDFHQDLLYMANPPAVQVLHCLRPSACGGGATRFSDAVRAYEALQRANPKLAQNFGRYAVTYQYRNRGQWYRRRRSHLERGITDNRSEPAPSRWSYPWAFRAVNWSPPFQGPLDMPDAVGPDAVAVGRSNGQLRNYIKAARLYKELLARKKAVYETTLQEGECVIFHNRRIAHARSAFEVVPGEAERWLRGCYVDEDPLRNRWRTMIDDAFLESRAPGWAEAVRGETDQPSQETAQ